MKQYLNLLQDVLEHGEVRQDRTGTGTLSKFGMQARYDLRQGFPVVTTKKVFFKAIVHEILWFISGDTNIKYLVDNGVNIWNEWPYANYQKSDSFKGETLEEFIEKIKSDATFALRYGDLGPVYGKQWRNFNGIDQFNKLLSQLKNNPNSRRHIVSAWNPVEVEDMLLPPCHSLFQLYVSEEGFLDLQLYQRSGDLFLGIPFNIASYALLLELIAKECDLKPRYFIHTIGDAHIYLNHVEQVKLQLSREPKPLSKINIKNKSIYEIKFEDIVLENYQSWPGIKGKVAV
ncbi:thymidylate synthase [Mesoplasma syrphidae]|uniref:Thymidylate synthase n=1 Tax=Mesoplasma syrphidae TaxID=225999 RepID=A0A2K9BJU3_9MOLU|nr:thymidylate synthase [Mesoplasma syrphidae]AUF83541.1 thymidylate synthase [Mesoplasma syrphidae]